MDPKWITRDIALIIHGRSLSDHGGADGVRDITRLEGALDRPRNLAAYGNADLFELAASLAVGLVKNHPFVDGNKRTSFLASFVFLGMNGWELDADEVEAAAIMVDLAAGKVSEAEMALWLKAKSAPVNQ